MQMESLNKLLFPFEIVCYYVMHKDRLEWFDHSYGTWS